MRTSIATVCLSGTLTEKLEAAAGAGFDGVELFEPDLVASPASPQEVVALADKLGLTLDLYQPFRDAEGVDEEEFQRVLRRARAKFDLMGRLGIDTMLVCSNVGTATIDDDEVSAGQLRRLGDEAAGHGIRLAFEALASTASISSRADTTLPRSKGSRARRSSSSSSPTPPHSPWTCSPGHATTASSPGRAPSTSARSSVMS